MAGEALHNAYIGNQTLQPIPPTHRRSQNDILSQGHKHRSSFQNYWNLRCKRLGDGAAVSLNHIIVSILRCWLTRNVSGISLIPKLWYLEVRNYVPFYVCSKNWTFWSMIFVGLSNFMVSLFGVRHLGLNPTIFAMQIRIGPESQVEEQGYLNIMCAAAEENKN